MSNFMTLDEFLTDVTWELSPAAVNVIRFKNCMTTAIINARTQRKMNQKEFAAFMGVPPRMVRKWEAGNYNYTIKQICEICERLHIIPSLEIKK